MYRMTCPSQPFESMVRLLRAIERACGVLFFVVASSVPDGITEAPKLGGPHPEHSLDPN